MKAIQVKRYGGPEVLELCDLPIPKARDGEVLVRVEAAGVNPADGKWRSGAITGMSHEALPFVPGYDIAGSIEEAGSSGLQKGTRVAAMLHPMTKGGYAQYATVSASAIAIIPEGLETALAAAAPTACLTGLQIVERQLPDIAGKTVLVTGALGMVGRVAMHYALASGAQVVAGVRSGTQDKAIAAGARAAIALDEDASCTELFDHVLDTVGGEAVGRLCRNLRPGGRIITVATTPIPTEELTTQPAFYAVASSGTDLARILSDLASGKLRLSIERCLPLDEAAEAQRLVDVGGRSGKIILLPEQVA